MPPSRQARVQVACPHCGHEQPEPPTAFSTFCKKCGGHFRVQKALKPAPKIIKAGPKKQNVACFECGTELEVPPSATSTMCKRCGRYVDLQDYRITSAIAKNFKTKGVFTVESKGCVFNTDSIVGDAVIRGKYHGKLTTERSLTIYSAADIKGSLTAAHLIIPEENHFRWPGEIAVGSAEISGELTANLRAKETVVLKSAARFFGNVRAKNLVVENGAVLEAEMRIGVDAAK
jgi:cytoskeletal protein CcmA (bactofilin family)